MIWSCQLNGNRRCFAAADAQGGDAAFEVTRLEGVQQRHDQARAAGADGMPESAGAAVDVDFRMRQLELMHGRHGHHRESLVDLVEIHVFF